MNRCVDWVTLASLVPLGFRCGAGRSLLGLEAPPQTLDLQSWSQTLSLKQLGWIQETWEGDALEQSHYHRAEFGVIRIPHSEPRKRFLQEWCGGGGGGGGGLPPGTRDVGDVGAWTDRDQPSEVVQRAFGMEELLEKVKPVLS